MITSFTAGALLLLAVSYAAGLRSPRLRLEVLRPAAFAAGWLSTAIALLSPLHELAEQRLSAHMLQHELLMVLAAPLLAFGRPHLALLSLFKGPRRRMVARWMRHMQMRTPIAWLCQAAALWIWHLPLLYEASVQNPLIHAAQHLSFFGTSLLFWWSLLDRRSDYGSAALYVFLTSLHSGLLGVLLFLSPHPWYASYAFMPGAAEDQQLAGLLMWVPGGVVLAMTALLLLWRWLDDLEHRAVARERLASLTSRTPRALGVVALVAAAAFAIPGCNDARATAVALTGGNPDHGKEHIRKYGCWTCHSIPGVQGANGAVGPPLTAVANRAYIAGHPNSPQHMINWIRHPQTVRAPTPMPDMGVSETDARDIAAYLYTLR